MYANIKNNQNVTCLSNQDCKISLINNDGTLVSELRSSIIRKAAILEKEKNKKKKK